MGSCNMKTIKYILLLFNFVSCILALGIIIAGALVLSDINEFRHFLEGRILIPPIILIVVGTIILIIATIGTYGAIKHKFNLLVVFGISLLVIFIIEVTVVIIVMIFKSDFDTGMRDTLKESMMKYSDSEIDKTAWDSVQTKFNCCGVDASTDWQQNDANNFARGLPPSCCKVNLGNTCANSQYEAYQAGCFSELVMKVRKNAKVLIGVGVSIAVIEIAGIILAFLLAYAIKKENEGK